MKSMKLDHHLAQQVVTGEKTSTWRVNDDKDLHVNDRVELIDKLDPANPATWTSIGIATIVTILEKQLGAVSQDDMDGNDKYTSTEQILTEFRGYYGPQVSAETPVKIIRFTFEPHKEGEQSRPGEVLAGKLYTDGGSRGNPGPSASAFVLLNEHDKIIAEKGLYLGVTTNNQAEYQSLKMGLTEAHKQGISHLQVYMDSMLVINQMKGVYKVKNADLRPVHQSVQELADQFESITFTHVPREHNKQADALVNEVLDAS